MTEYVRVSATPSTPTVDANGILGWNGVSGWVFMNTGTVTWGGSRSGTITWDTKLAPFRYYGEMLLYSKANTADEYKVEALIYNADGVQVGDTFLWYYRGGYKTEFLRKVVNMPKDGKIVINWSVRAGYTKKSDMQVSMYVDNRNVAPDVPPPPEVPPEVETKFKYLTATLFAEGIVRTSAYQNFSYLGEKISSDIVIPASFNANHINLWDFFFNSQGRRPNPGEKINFVIPEDRVFVAPFGYNVATRRADIPIPGNSVHKGYSYFNDNVIAGFPAVSLKGWDRSLNNNITVDVKGKVIGSFPVSRDPVLTPFDKATGRPIEWNTFKTMGWSDTLAYWWYIQYLCIRGAITGISASSIITLTNPIKNPAIYTEVDCTIIVRNGGYVLGGGGNQTTSGMYKRSDIPNSMVALNGVSEDKTNVHAGDAIHAGGYDNIIRIENYGYVSGGGGGGASMGREAAGLLDNSAVFAKGGSGAPLAGIWAMNTFPCYIDLAYVRTLPVVPKTTANNYTGFFDLAPDFLEPNPLPATNNIVELTEARVLSTVEISKVGFDTNGDNIHDISQVKSSIDTTPRLLSPTSGVQDTSANNYNSVISGSGGSPGVNGQSATIVTAGSSWLSDVPNTPGLKGSITVDKGSNNAFVVNNYPGSLFNL